jgi:hypothetical protein
MAILMQETFETEYFGAANFYDMFQMNHSESNIVHPAKDVVHVPHHQAMTHCMTSSNQQNRKLSWLRG